MDTEITEQDLTENFSVEHIRHKIDYALLKVSERNEDSNFLFITQEWFSGKWNYCFTYSTPGMDWQTENRITLKSIEHIKQLINLLN